MKIWTVDAFTKQAYQGNPAAVAIVNEFPSDTVCQQMAAEINLSETAFVKPIADHQFHIRWFTPMVEVKLCGHATLAAAHILYQENIANAESIQLQSLSGALNVYRRNDGALTLDFPLQATGPALNKENFKNLFNATISNVVKAYDDIIIELPDEAAVRNLNIDPIPLSAIDCRGIIVTAKADRDYDFISRFFAPAVGVLEDPVTGSAHCKLAHYWQSKLNKTTFRAYQASARGGELDLEIHQDRLYITGYAKTMMVGEWLGNR